MKDLIVINPVSTIATAVVFLICLSVFVFITIRAIRMPRHKEQQLSRMPLDDAESPPASRNTPHE